MLLELRLAWRNVWRNPRRTGAHRRRHRVRRGAGGVLRGDGGGSPREDDRGRGARALGHLALPGRATSGEPHPRGVSGAGPPPAPRPRPHTRRPGWAPRLTGSPSSPRTPRPRASPCSAWIRARGTVTTLPARWREGSPPPPDPPPSSSASAWPRTSPPSLGDKVLLYSARPTTSRPPTTCSPLAGVARLSRAGARPLPRAHLPRRRPGFFVYGDRVTEVAPGGNAAPPRRRGGRARGLGRRPREHARSALGAARCRSSSSSSFWTMRGCTYAGDPDGRRRLRHPQHDPDGGPRAHPRAGVLLALGLRPRAVFRLVYLESLLLGGVGLVLGLAVGIALVRLVQAHPVPLGEKMAGAMQLFGAEPVMTWKLKPMNPVGSSLTVLGVARRRPLSRHQGEPRSSGGRPAEPQRRCWSGSRGATSGATDAAPRS